MTPGMKEAGLNMHRSKGGGGICVNEVDRVQELRG
jgi:hypothetical protein